MSERASEPAAAIPTGPNQHPEPRPDRRLLELLVCPVTKTRLVYDAERQELVSKAARLAFPIRAGVPLMTVDSARELDAR